MQTFVDFSIGVVLFILIGWIVYRLVLKMAPWFLREPGEPSGWRRTQGRPDAFEPIYADTDAKNPGAWWRAKEYRTADLPFDETPPTDCLPDEHYTSWQEKL